MPNIIIKKEPDSEEKCNVNNINDSDNNTNNVNKNDSVNDDINNINDHEIIKKQSKK